MSEIPADRPILLTLEAVYDEMRHRVHGWTRLQLLQETAVRCGVSQSRVAQAFSRAGSDSRVPL